MDHFYNIVTKREIINEIKKSRYFKVNLGMVGTIELPGREHRTLNERDKFAYFYNAQYKTIIYIN